MTPWIESGIYWTNIILVLITVTATITNYLFFRSQIEPNVILYVSHDEKRPSILILIIENIGRGFAKDIKFSLSRPIPQKAYGIDEKAEVPKNMDHGPLIDGIPAMGPGSKRIITWGQYGGLKKGIGNDIVNVTITYKSDSILQILARRHKTICPIDVKSFEGIDASDKNWDKKTADELERIANIILHVTKTPGRARFKKGIEQPELGDK